LGAATLAAFFAFHGFDAVADRPWPTLIFTALAAAAESVSL
jgi:hypothetical protein